MQLAELYVSVQPDTSKFGPRLVRDLERKYRNKAIEIAVKPDTRRFVAESRRAAADAGRHAGPRRDHHSAEGELGRKDQACVTPWRQHA